LIKTIRVTMLALVCAMPAHADFSYTSTRKSAQGPAAAAGDQTTKHYYKGQKMKTDSATTAMIIDFDAQTLTTLNHTQKTYTLMKFSDMGQQLKDTGMEVKIDVKETGQRKNINGFNAAEIVMTMAMESPQTAQAGMKMVVEVSNWLSPDPPGTQELRAFNQKHMNEFPWASLAGGAGGSQAASMQKALADMQKKAASLGGVPVLSVMKLKSSGNEAQAAQMQQGMQQAMAQMEAMRKKGGAQGQAAEQAMARMGGMAGGGGALFEITTESTGFSTAAIPDSTFAIPDGYQKK
jgi:hypothetical protein